MKPSSFKLTQLKQIIGRWQKAMFEGNGWNSIYFGNHDVSSCAIAELGPPLT